MKRLTILAALVCGSFGSVHAAGMEGSYRVEGRNVDGSTYAGKAVISVTSKTECRITWTLADGSSSAGKCIQRGRSFASAFRLGKESGLALYEQQPDGSLQGTWNTNDTVGQEVLTPMR